VGGGGIRSINLLHELSDRWGYVRDGRAGKGGSGKQVGAQSHVSLDTHWSSVYTDVRTESCEFIIPYVVHWRIVVPAVIVVKNSRNNFRKGISVIGPIDFVMDQNRVRETMEVGGTVTKDDDYTS
jgi:hypothetical protein